MSIIAQVDGSGITPPKAKAPGPPKKMLNVRSMLGPKLEPRLMTRSGPAKSPRKTPLTELLALWPPLQDRVRVHREGRIRR